MQNLVNSRKKLNFNFWSDFQRKIWYCVWTNLWTNILNLYQCATATTTIDETSTDDKISETSGKLQSEETEGEMLELDGLDTFTNYSIRVAAYTRAGRGKTSKQIFCKTAEDGNILSLLFKNWSILLIFVDFLNLFKCRFCRLF